MPIGWQELAIILLIVVVLFGANKLPEIGSGLGKGIRGFKEESGFDNADKSKSKVDAIDRGQTQEPIIANTSTSQENVIRADEI